MFARPAMGQEVGQVTGLPLPRFVSLKAGQANIRRGPGTSYRIDWRFVRRSMPLRVVAEYENWRNVRDRDGMGGWVHFALLSGVRTVIVEGATAEMLSEPVEGAPIAAMAEAGVVARLGECTGGWCRIEASGHEGWVREDAIWGTDRDL
ncbi:SH3 domain-containing protein [Roseobacter sp. HKCCA0434]|uniref:SH3 domain-containing protein n=1 Tax=Roseobacter sp. HKCCA0434 TaxID=3079297 RepID=UPI002905BF78|nr:SH3 domain-containing protein [Roseobacter sp. HKCCA0434]